MSWALGLMLCMGLFVVVWVGAEIVDADRKELRRVRKLEAARKSWAAMIDDDATRLEQGCYYGRDK